MTRIAVLLAAVALVELMLTIGLGASVKEVLAIARDRRGVVRAWPRRAVFPPDMEIASRWRIRPRDVLREFGDLRAPASLMRDERGDCGHGADDVEQAWRGLEFVALTRDRHRRCRLPADHIAEGRDQRCGYIQRIAQTGDTLGRTAKRVGAHAEHVDEATQLSAGLARLGNPRKNERRRDGAAVAGLQIFRQHAVHRQVEAIGAARRRNAAIIGDGFRIGRRAVVEFVIIGIAGDEVIGVEQSLAHAYRCAARVVEDRTFAA